MQLLRFNILHATQVVALLTALARLRAQPSHAWLTTAVRRVQQQWGASHSTASHSRNGETYSEAQGMHTSSDEDQSMSSSTSTGSSSSSNNIAADNNNSRLGSSSSSSSNSWEPDSDSIGFNGVCFDRKRPHSAPPTAPSTAAPQQPPTTQPRHTTAHSHTATPRHTPHGHPPAVLLSLSLACLQYEPELCDATWLVEAVGQSLGLCSSSSSSSTTTISTTTTTTSSSSDSMSNQPTGISYESRALPSPFASAGPASVLQLVASLSSLAIGLRTPSPQPHTTQQQSQSQGTLPPQPNTQQPLQVQSILDFQPRTTQQQSRINATPGPLPNAPNTGWSTHTSPPLSYALPKIASPQPQPHAVIQVLRPHRAWLAAWAAAAACVLQVV